MTRATSWKLMPSSINTPNFHAYLLLLLIVFLSLVAFLTSILNCRHLRRNEAYMIAPYHNVQSYLSETCHCKHGRVVWRAHVVSWKTRNMLPPVCLSVWCLSCVSGVLQFSVETFYHGNGINFGKSAQSANCTDISRCRADPQGLLLPCTSHIIIAIDPNVISCVTWMFVFVAPRALSALKRVQRFRRMIRIVGMEVWFLARVKTK